MEINILPLSSENLNDFLYFFDNLAFTDNKDWSGCYCFFYHFAGNDEDWQNRTGENNRLSATRLINEGTMKGYLAYSNGKPIGWCNVNDKCNYSRVLPGIDDMEGKIASIVCFTIAPQWRGKGVASQILSQICSDYLNKGYAYIEAYPRKGDLSNAFHYHGPLSMYLKSGFKVYKSFNEYDIVRKEL